MMTSRQRPLARPTRPFVDPGGIGMGQRLLTLEGVLDWLLEEFGLRRRQAAGEYYPSADSAAQLVELRRISYPADRRLSEQSLRDLLPKMLKRQPIDPVHVRSAPDGMSLHHGMHRFSLSLALGFQLIPCRLWRPEDFV
jgi:hypothetical protein